MPLHGSAVLANWGGVAPGSERDYSRWHAMEHMPERLAVPGFLRGRRAVAEAHETDAPLFMMYEAETAAVFESEAYLARLNDPTPWTRRILSSYVRPIRTVCHVVDSLGDGIGGVLGSIRIDRTTSGEGESVSEAAMRSAFHTATRETDLIGGHLLRGDPTVGQADTVEKAARESRGDPDRVVAWAILFEAVDRESVEAALSLATKELANEAVEPRLGVYVTTHVLSAADLSAALGMQL